MRSLLLLLLVACACSSSSPAILGQPPAPPDPSTAASPGPSTTFFVVDSLALGDGPVDPTTGDVTNGPWRTTGFNLDRKDTTKASTDVCALQPNAPDDVQVDGDDGIDNAWGAMVLPLLQTASGLPTPSRTVSSAIDSGDSTLEIAVTGLPDDPAASALGLSASVFVTAPTTGSDRPIAAWSVADGATLASGAKVRFATAYASDGVVVARDSAQPLALMLPLGGGWVRLTIHGPVLTLDRRAGAGVIAGVLDPGELAAAFDPLGLRVQAGWCGGMLRQELAGVVLSASDIMLDGTNAPGETCSGISIGVGFTANVTAAPSTVAAWTPPGGC